MIIISRLFVKGSSLCWLEAIHVHALQGGRGVRTGIGAGTHRKQSAAGCLIRQKRTGTVSSNKLKEGNLTRMKLHRGRMFFLSLWRFFILVNMYNAFGHIIDIVHLTSDHSLKMKYMRDNGGSRFKVYSSSRTTRVFRHGIHAQKRKLASSWVQSRDEE